MMYDLCIVGGGIQGTALASEAAARGLRVVLCEQGDLAGQTSSRSTSLIHGGLRYLEHYAFSMVRDSLRERRILLKKAPHLIHPQRFIIPQNPAYTCRPSWLVRLGLFLYDHLLLNTGLPRSSSLNLQTYPNNPLKAVFKNSFTYYDCTTHDSRLTLANALQAQEAGAQIWRNTTVTGAKVLPEGAGWEIQYQDNHKAGSLQAKGLINATGPWADRFLSDTLQIPSPYTLQLVKGSHIVLPQLYPGEDAYLLQHSDQRIIFVIPFEKKFTLIGTTDILYQGEPQAVRINEEEKHYLCEAYNTYFKKAISPAQICHSWSGVRPLIKERTDKPENITRDYRLHLHRDQKAPLLSIFGGKLTSHRILAKKAFFLLWPFFPESKAYDSQHVPLPGGDMLGADIQAFIQNLQGGYPKLKPAFLERLAKTYGTRAYKILTTAQKEEDLGQAYGADLYQAEVDYLKQHEWADSLEDILFRRTRLHLVWQDGGGTELGG